MDLRVWAMRVAWGERSRPQEPQAEVSGIRGAQWAEVSKEAHVGRAEWRRDHAGSWGLGKDTGSS